MIWCRDQAEKKYSEIKIFFFLLKLLYDMQTRYKLDHNNLKFKQICTPCDNIF